MTMNGHGHVDERTRLLSPPQRPRISLGDEEDGHAHQKLPNVSWDGPDDPANPKNWRPARKWTCAMIVSVYSLIAPTASSMVVPAMPALTQDLGITSSSVTQLTLSIYVLGWGFGPVILGPLSEIYGRAPLLHFGQLGFLIFNTLCTLATNQNAFLGLRFLSGVFGSGPLALGSGVLADLWVSDERGISLAVYTLMALLGPSVGPLLGGVLIQYRSWHDIFYVCSVFTAISLIIGILFLRETFGVVLLHRKLMQLLEKQGYDTSQLDDSSRIDRLIKLVRVDLTRPFVLLGTQPIIQTLAIYMGFLFGLNHLTISTFHALWRDVYHESDIIASCNYLSITLGFAVGTQTAGPANDRIYAYLKRRHGGSDCPEYRVWLMIPGAVVVPTGLLIYGWSASAQPPMHWLVPNVGILVYSAGLLMAYQCIQAYVLDCYPIYAASAMGALTVLRSLAGFALPLIAPLMYRNLGYGWSSTILAAVALVVGSVAPWVLKEKGKVLREKSPYAAGDVNVVL